MVYKPVQLAHATSQTNKQKKRAFTSSKPMGLEHKLMLTIKPRCTIGGQSPFSQLLRVVSIAFIIGTILMAKRRCAVLIWQTLSWRGHFTLLFHGEQKINALKCTSDLMQICNNNLPSQKENEVHPSEEEGNSPSFLFESKLAVTVWENINQGWNVTNPLQNVGQFKEIFDFLWYKEKRNLLKTSLYKRACHF